MIFELPFARNEITRVLKRKQKILFTLCSPYLGKISNQSVKIRLHWNFKKTLKTRLLEAMPRRCLLAANLSALIRFDAKSFFYANNFWTIFGENLTKDFFLRRFLRCLDKTSQDKTRQDKSRQDKQTDRGRQDRQNKTNKTNKQTKTKDSRIYEGSANNHFNKHRQTRQTDGQTDRQT